MSTSPARHRRLAHGVHRRFLAGAPLALAAGLAWTGNAGAATTVPGGTLAASTTWALAGSPYLVQGAVVIASGATLTIAAGVEVRFAGATQIQVNAGGALVAAGDAGQPVVLTSDAVSPAAGDWLFVRALPGSTLRLEHTDFSYAGLSGYPSLWIATSTAEVRHCRVHHGAGPGVQLDGAGLTPTLADVDIDHHAGPALYQNLITMAPLLADLTFAGCAPNALVIGNGFATADVSLDGSAAVLNGAPVRLASHLDVRSGATVTIAPGTTLMGLAGVFQIQVNGGGTLRAQGTAAAPIVLTSDAASPAPGDWYAVRALAGSTVTLEHCLVAYAGRSGFAAISAEHATAQLAVTATEVRDNAADALWVAREAQPFLEGNRLFRNGFGVRSVNTKVFTDARMTWWGDPTGPFHPTLNPDGKGNAVSDRVLFIPWAVDPEGTPSSGLAVQLVGPASASPGQRVEYSAEYYAARDVADAVLVVTLPFGSIWVRSGDERYDPEQHQVFWRLGDLAAGTAGTKTARVALAWGLPQGYQDEAAAAIAGGDATSSELDFDVAYYRSVPDEVPASARILSESEVAAEIAGNTAVAHHAAAATALGYVPLGGRLVSRQDGGGFAELGYIDPRRHGAIFVRRGVADGSVLRTTFTPSELRIEDEAGGLAITAPNGAPRLLGSWAAAAAGAPAGAAEALARQGGAPPAATYLKCLRNCAARNAASYVLGKLHKLVDYAQQVESCGRAILSKGKDRDKAIECMVIMAAKMAELGAGVEIPKDEISLLMTCNDACLANPASHICSGRAIVRDPTPEQKGWFWSWAPNLPGRTYLVMECADGFLLDGVLGECPPGFRVDTKVWNRTLTPPAPCVLDPGTERARDLDTELRIRQQLGDRVQAGFGTVATTVAAPRDPNAKEGPPPQVLPDERLAYTIYYENVGAGTADGVYVVDELDPALDDSTLEIGGAGTYYAASRSVIWSVGTLAPHGEPGASGSVTLSARLVPGVAAGRRVRNRAVVTFPSVPEETPTNWVESVVTPLAADAARVTTEAGQPVGVQLTARPVSAPALAFSLTRPPSFGTLSGTPPALVYTPGSGFIGSDRFAFVATSGSTTSPEAEVTLEVTAAAGDAVRPAVTWVWPEAGSTVTELRMLPSGSSATGPAYEPALLVELSEPLDPVSVTGAAVSVRDASGRTVPVAVAWDAASRRLRIALAERWRPTSYTVTVGTTLADLAGNPLAAPHTWSFTAKPPGWVRGRLWSGP